MEHVYSTICRLLVLLAMCCVVLQAYAEDINPEACDCDSLHLSEAEIAGGCPHSVKMETCPRYREAMLWQERLRQERERRDLERRMEPRYIPGR